MNKLIKKYIIPVFIALLIISNTGAYFCIWYQQKQYKDLSIQVRGNKKDIEGIRSAVKLLGADNQEKMKVTIEALLATMDRIDNAFKVYDNNVDIYNSRITKLQSQVDSIINYLSK